MDPFSIGDPVGKAAYLNQNLPGLLKVFREVTGQIDLQLSRESADEALFHLNNVAWQIARSLFDQSQPARKFMETVTAALARVFAGATSDQQTWPIVNIIKEENEPLGWSIPFEFFPFAASYPATQRQTLPFECFLGLRAPLIRVRRLGRHSLTRDPTDQIKTLLLSTRDRLPGVRDQRAYFEENSRDFAVVRWPGDDETFPYPPLRQLTRLWLEEREIIHVACHYGISSPGSSDPAEFDFGAGCAIGAGALAGELTRHLGDRDALPLVFLNACNTATATDPHGAIIHQLADLGYSDIIGSRCQLPDRLAGQFARSLYGLLLSDERPSLADAVVLTRRKLAERLNPAGLLYVHYGSTLLRTEERRSPPPLPLPPPVAESSGILSALRGWFGGR
jgi:hypothetical protein